MLDGCGEGFAWVSCFGGGEANEFCAGEGEGGCDEDAAEALEAVVEGSRVVPEFAANVAAVGGTAAVEYNAEETFGCSRKRGGKGQNTQTQGNKKTKRATCQLNIILW